MANEVMLTKVRLSFPTLVEPKAVQPGQAEKYSADFIMGKDHVGLKEFNAVVLSMVNDKWKDNAQTILNMIQGDRKLRCFGEGNDRVNKKTFQPYDGYADKVYISAKSDNQPQMVKTNGTPVDKNNTMEAMDVARKLYGGCYVNVALRPWLQDNQHGRAVRCELIAVQFLEDGEAFGEGATDVSGMFGAVTGADDDDVPSFMQ